MLVAFFMNAYSWLFLNGKKVPEKDRIHWITHLGLQYDNVGIAGFQAGINFDKDLIIFNVNKLFADSYKQFDATYNFRRFKDVSLYFYAFTNTLNEDKVDEFDESAFYIGVGYNIFKSKYFDLTLREGVSRTRYAITSSRWDDPTNTGGFSSFETTNKLYIANKKYLKNINLNIKYLYAYQKQAYRSNVFEAGLNYVINKYGKVTMHNVYYYDDYGEREIFGIKFTGYIYR